MDVDEDASQAHGQSKAIPNCSHGCLTARAWLVILNKNSRKLLRQDLDSCFTDVRELCHNRFKQEGPSALNRKVLIMVFLCLHKELRFGVLALQFDNRKHVLRD